MKIYTKDLKPGDRFISTGDNVYTVLGVKSEKGQTHVQYEIVGCHFAYWTASLATVEII